MAKTNRFGHGPDEDSNTSDRWWVTEKVEGGTNIIRGGLKHDSAETLAIALNEGRIDVNEARDLSWTQLKQLIHAVEVEKEIEEFEEQEERERPLGQLEMQNTLLRLAEMVQFLMLNVEVCPPGHSTPATTQRIVYLKELKPLVEDLQTRVKAADRITEVEDDDEDEDDGPYENEFVPLKGDD